MALAVAPPPAEDEESRLTLAALVAEYQEKGLNNHVEIAIQALHDYGRQLFLELPEATLRQMLAEALRHHCHKPRHKAFRVEPLNPDDPIVVNEGTTEAPFRLASIEDFLDRPIPVNGQWKKGWSLTREEVLHVVGKYEEKVAENMMHLRLWRAVLNAMETHGAGTVEELARKGGLPEVF
jgi:hypothetical protein